MLVPVYSVTLFLSAVLLFSVQPMVGKMILPILGGAPAVWNTCLVFFQISLLLGYLYAHLSTRWLGVRLQAIAHLGLLLLPLFLLPISLRGKYAAAPEAEPVMTLFGLLLLTAGLPFLAVATSAPLLQKWFAQTGHGSAKDPYFLYAASNAGSLLALLGYPLLFEPAMTLAEQSRQWRNGYLLLLILVFLCAVLLWKSSRAAVPGPGVMEPSVVTPLRRLRWVLYAFVPSSLMLGVTTYITTDIAAFPLLWVIPLSLYLLTFILVFARRQFLPRAWISRALALLAIPAIIALILEANYPHFILIPEHLILFFGLSMLCHGALADDRPSPSHLTEFYLWMSVGGVLGGVFNALIAPLVFDSVLEYPLMIVIACLYRLPIGTSNENPHLRRMDFVFPAGVAILTFILVFVTRFRGLHVSQFGLLLSFALPAVLVLGSADRPVRYALGLAALLIGTAGYVGPLGKSIDVARNFFGVVRVTNDASGDRRLMIHGNTVHGAESLDPSLRGRPLTYYGPDGPAGDIFRAFENAGTRRAVGVIGLGAGSLASYAQPGDTWTIYEINPAVVRFARTPAYFSFLSGSKARQTNIVPGDARLSLVGAEAAVYGLLVLDAFSSDSIPVHLVTREALELYLSKLQAGGILAFHISNRYLELEPVIGRLAAEFNLVARSRNKPSQWVVMARSENDLGPIRMDPNWHVVTVNAHTPIWTDDFSDIAGVLRW
jgi:hypothetical protein